MEELLKLGRLNSINAAGNSLILAGLELFGNHEYFALGFVLCTGLYIMDMRKFHLALKDMKNEKRTGDDHS